MVFLKAKHMALIIPGIFVVLIGLAMAFGRWNAAGGRRFSDLVEGRTHSVGRGSGAGAGRGDGSGAGEASEHDASDRIVRGMTTFQDLSDWGVAPDALAKLVGGEPGAAGTTVREWCSERGIGFGTVKGRIQALVDAVSP